MGNGPRSIVHHNGTRIKFAVVGYGHIGKRHAEMIDRNPECELVAIVDIKAKSELGIGDEVPFFESLEKFLESGMEVDVINIATPNGFHAFQANLCLESNHHVVIEKPMALHKEDALKLIEKAAEVNKHVFTVMQNRYSPPSIWIKEVIESGRYIWRN